LSKYEKALKAAGQELKLQTLPNDNVPSDDDSNDDEYMFVDDKSTKREISNNLKKKVVDSDSDDEDVIFKGNNLTSNGVKKRSENKEKKVAKFLSVRQRPVDGAKSLREALAQIQQPAQNQPLPSFTKPLPLDKPKEDDSAEDDNMNVDDPPIYQPPNQTNEKS